MAINAQNLLSGKVALITGGSHGIGRAIAAAYAEAGAQVFICARNHEEIKIALSEIRQRAGSIEGIAGDISQVQDVDRIVARALKRFSAIDVLVNNASILGPRQTIAEYPRQAWQQVIDVNLTGLFLMTQAVLPGMLARQKGSIINLTSGVGRTGRAKWGAYAVSKAGVESFTQVLAEEVKSAGIRVNAVNPAATRTRMRAQAYPSEEPATLPTAEVLTPIFIHLASDASQEITGQSLNARDWMGKTFD
jgi:NAD(P)-dependent dehydrogenase (short-subunit alcohol dehydrogenase family)